MKTRFCILFLLLTVPAFGQVSYWFQGWERKPDAAQAQAYFMLPGTNVTFTYTNNRVVINSTGGGGAVTNTGTNCFTFSAVSPVVVLLSGSGCSNVEYSLIGPLTNWAKYQTNSFDSAGAGTAAAQAATNGMTTIVYSNPATFYPSSNPSNFLVGITNLLISGSNITFITNLAGAITISATDTVGSAGSAIITNVFTTNLTTILQSNSVIVDVDGRLILGTNGATTTLTPDVRTGPAKLSVYGDLALNRIGASGASSTFLYTIRSNFYTVTTAGDGALVISNTTGPNYIALAGVNAAARQMGMGLKNPNNLYAWGVDLSDNGSTNWFLYDLRANALAFMVDFSQHFGVKTNNPIFDLDVRGDANVSGVYRVKGIPIWSNTITAGTNINLTTNVAAISINVSGAVITNTDIRGGGVMINTNLLIKGLTITTNGEASYRSNRIAPTAITLSASATTLWTNVQAYNVFLFCDGGPGLDDLAINGHSGVFTAGAAFTIPLQPGEWVGITTNGDVVGDTHWKPQ